MTTGDIVSDTEFREAPFEMANLRPERTGLPFIVWISQRGGAQHDIRIKLSRTPKAGPDWVTIALRPTVEDLSGTLSRAELVQVRKWVLLNLAVLVDHWDGRIPYTEDVLAKIRPLPEA
jgi:hypothetical protein